MSQNERGSRAQAAEEIILEDARPDAGLTAEEPDGRHPKPSIV